MADTIQRQAVKAMLKKNSTEPHIAEAMGVLDDIMYAANNDRFTLVTLLQAWAYVSGGAVYPPSGPPAGGGL